MKAIAAILLAVPFAAAAAGYPPLSLSDSGETCYTWEGGHKSAGSFSKCSPQVAIAAAPRLPPPVQPSPIMMPVSAAPVTCVPPPRPIFKKRKPAPKKC